ncbi:MAG: hypothetical protein WA838_02390, partial [Xanthobacteraceae bacterium]
APEMSWTATSRYCRTKPGSTSSVSGLKTAGQAVRHLVIEGERIVYVRRINERISQGVAKLETQRNDPGGGSC